jgi:copper chaperone NosL
MRKRNRFIATCAIAVLVLLAGCQADPLQPVAIDANDTCSFCNMAISEKRYAAELIDADGKPFKFDDIGCMASFIEQKKNPAPVHAIFVMDFERREWIKAHDAFYVRSAEFHTPMSGHIVALNDQSRAQEAVSRYHGSLLRFADVVKSGN